MCMHVTLTIICYTFIYKEISMATLQPFNSEGYYLATTGTYDSDVIQGLDVNSPEFKDYLVYIQQSLNDHALFVNNKPSGKLNSYEQISGRTLGAPQGTSLGTRSDLRIAAYHVTVFVNDLAMGAVNYLHNIPDVDNVNFNGLYLWGSVTDPVNFITLSLPYIGPEGYIGLKYDDTNLIVTSSFDTSAYTKGKVTIEYTKY